MVTDSKTNDDEYKKIIGLCICLRVMVVVGSRDKVLSVLRVIVLLLAP
jgi:hypothetical protein